jgi:hypothetical protein
MRTSYTTLMQSKYFNPAINSAIFDGPLRIYFAQFQESAALKIYFLAQQKFNDEIARAKLKSKASGANVMVIVYPSVESFDLSFEGENPAGPFKVEKWREDIVIGLRGPLEEEHLDLFMDQLRLTLENWRPAPLEVATSLM